MAHLSLLEKHSKRLLERADFIFAFPGVGKTPLAQQKGGFVDADFGFWRKAFLQDKSREKVLFKPYARWIKLLVKDGYQVLVNQPDLIRFVPANRTVVVLPFDPSFAALKLHVPIPTVQEWIENWKDAAEEHGVPVVWLDEGLDTFLE